MQWKVGLEIYFWDWRKKLINLFNWRFTDWKLKVENWFRIKVELGDWAIRIDWKFIYFI